MNNWRRHGEDREGLASTSLVDPPRAASRSPAGWRCRVSRGCGRCATRTIRSSCFGRGRGYCARAGSWPVIRSAHAMCRVGEAEAVDRARHVRRLRQQKRPGSLVVGESGVVRGAGTFLERRWAVEIRTGPTPGSVRWRWSTDLHRPGRRRRHPHLHRHGPGPHHRARACAARARTASRFALRSVSRSNAACASGEVGATRFGRAPSMKSTNRR